MRVIKRKEVIYFDEVYEETTEAEAKLIHNGEDGYLVVITNDYDISWFREFSTSEEVEAHDLYAMIRRKINVQFLEEWEFVEGDPDVFSI